MSQFVNRFAGTASYYARFRPGYPSALYDLLSHQAGLDHSTTSVLDLGCGPGIIALGLASRTKRVLGVDPDTEMLKEADVAARTGGIENASWALSTAEDFVDQPQSYRLITIASAFNWMDRQLVAEKAYDLLEPDGLLAVIGNPTPLWDIRERRGLGAVIAEVQDRWFRTEEGPVAPINAEIRPEVVIRTTSFGQARVAHIPTEQRWNVERLVGFLRSTSWRPDQQLGDRFPEFVAELDSVIRTVEPSGEWPLQAMVEVITARR